jgi:hypothetical protein
VSDLSHADHHDYVQWLGRPFDPLEFSIADTNAALQRVR